ncbi:MAG: cation-transporting P-type ATPase, partial [Candidatus Azobacteroides sp.]|nr:cation-transporting P-type ATPase [Candidatus Azobacteroides sp.]
MKAWHSIEIEEVIRLTDSDSIKGLSENEVKERLQTFGKNLLPEKKKQSKIIKFLKHFNDILIYILFVAAIVTFFVKGYFDAIIILI